MTTDYNVISCQKTDKSQQWLFSYDNTEQLIQTLLEMGHDGDCELNWAEINKLIRIARKLEETHPLSPT